MVRKELFFRITELANSAFSSEEKKRYLRRMKKTLLNRNEIDSSQLTYLENVMTYCDYTTWYCLIRFTTLCDDLMAAVLSVDANLHAQLNADIQRELNMELNRLRAGQRVKDSEIAKVGFNHAYV